MSKTTEKSATVPMATRAFGGIPTSVDIEARTFVAVISDATPVQECIYDRKSGVWMEAMVVLPPENVDLSRLPGMPLQDGHKLDSVRNTLGKVPNIWQEDDKLLASFELSPSNAHMMPDYAGGYHPQFSIGFHASDYDITYRDGELPLAVATTYTIFEVSSVPVGANPAAMMRSSDLVFPAPNLNVRAAVGGEDASTQENTMNLEELIAAAEAAVKAALEASTEGASDELLARLDALKGAPASTEGDARAEDTDELTAEQDEENKNLEASARTYGLDGAVRDMRLWKAKPTEIRSMLRKARLSMDAAPAAAPVVVKPKEQPGATATQRSKTPVDYLAIYSNLNSRGK